MTRYPSCTLPLFLSLLLRPSQTQAMFNDISQFQQLRRSQPIPGTGPLHSCARARVCVVVYYCRTYIKTVCARGC